MDSNSISDDSDTDEDQHDSDIEGSSSGFPELRGLSGSQGPKLTPEEIEELRKARRRQNNRESARRVRARRIEEFAELQEKVRAAAALREQLNGTCLQMEQDKQRLESHAFMMELEQQMLASTNGSLRERLAAACGDASAASRPPVDPRSSAIYQEARDIALLLMETDAPAFDAHGSPALHAAGRGGRQPPTLSRQRAPPEGLLRPIEGLDLASSGRLGAASPGAALWQQQPQQPRMRQSAHAPPMQGPGDAMRLPLHKAHSAEPRAPPPMYPELHRGRGDRYAPHEGVASPVSLPSMGSQRLAMLPHSLSEGAELQQRWPGLAHAALDHLDPYALSSDPYLHHQDVASGLLMPGFASPYDLAQGSTMTDQQFADSMQQLQHGQRHGGAHFLDAPPPLQQYAGGAAQHGLPGPHSMHSSSTMDASDAALLYAGMDLDALQALQQELRGRAPADLPQLFGEDVGMPQMISKGLQGLQGPDMGGLAVSQGAPALRPRLSSKARTLPQLSGYPPVHTQGQ